MPAYVESNSRLGDAAAATQAFASTASRYPEDVTFLAILLHSGYDRHRFTQSMPSQGEPKAPRYNNLPGARVPRCRSTWKSTK